VNWAILIGLMIFGASVRYFQNHNEPKPALLLGALAVAVLVAAGASLMAPAPQGGVAQAQDVPSGASVGGPKAAVAHAGRIRGVIHFEGTAPPPKLVTIPSSCANTGTVYDNAVLVKDGGLQNAFVWISQGLESYQGSAPTAPVTVDQHGCMYAPRVVGAQVGQPVQFLNSDPTAHNVHAQGVTNAGFNEIMLNQEAKLTKTFAQSEVMVSSKCDIHPWMSGFIGVVPHPYFAVTAPGGSFMLENVPPGEYTLEAWHEVYGKQTMTVKVAADTDASASITFKAQ
jgi:plastocyanin